MGECGAHCLGRALLRVPALGSLCRPRRERCRTERRRQQLHGLVEECPRLFLGDRRQAREIEVGQTVFRPLVGPVGDGMHRVGDEHRGLPGSQSDQAVPHGHQGGTGALDVVRRVEPARLAHLPRSGAAADCSRKGALRRATVRTGDRCERLCVGMQSPDRCRNLNRQFGTECLTVTLATGGRPESTFISRTPAFGVTIFL